MQQAKKILYLMLITVAALICQRQFFLGSSPWVIVAALWLALIETNTAFVVQSKRMIWMGFALVMVVALSEGLMPFPLIGATFILILCGLVVWALQARTDNVAALMMLPVFAMAARLLPSGDWFLSVRGILTGMALVVAARLVFLPHFLRHAIRATLLDTIRQFSQLSDDIFACFIEPAYLENHYLYEKRLHAQKNRCLSLLERLTDFEKQAKVRLSKTNDAHLLRLIDQCRYIFDNLMACAVLRFRTQDKATFGFLSRELAFTLIELTALFADMERMFNHKNPLLNTDGMAGAIRLMEQNCQQVLAVADKDPLVFQLFLVHLSNLREEIRVFFVAGSTAEVGFIYD